MRILVFLLSLFICFSSCKGSLKKDTPLKKDSDIDSVISSGRPNIVWIVAEDLGPYIPSFGDSTITTPNLSKLASEGICYDNFYTPHAVCAPARAAIITGMYANSIGANHMRTGPWFSGPASELTIKNYQKSMPGNLKPYEAVPSKEVKMFTEYLRANGYYCTNNSKEDYQFVKTPTSWDDSSGKAHWRNRPEGKPFFSVFNINVTHESRIWSKAKDSLWVAEDLDVPVPPYLPNTETALKDIRRMYSNIIEMDHRVGKIINELKEDGLLENTIVMWYTDHGGPLPRQKRMLYDSGTKVPMIIRFPEKRNQSRRDLRMISFIDLAPTMLSLTETKIPEHMQGTAFLGGKMRSVEPKYVFGAADRFDEKYDRVRSARDNRFKYIKYYEPEKPMFLEVSYRNQMPIMQELLRLEKENKLNPAQKLWFRNQKPEEELFDLLNDPHELHDLSQDPKHKDKLEELRLACRSWTEEIHDTGLIPEDELISRMHTKGIQNSTQSPTIQIINNKIHIDCETEGASIGYKIFIASENPDHQPWMVYTNPISYSKNMQIQTIAHRIGFIPSQVISKKINR